MWCSEDNSVYVHCSMLSYYHTCYIHINITYNIVHLCQILRNFCNKYHTKNDYFVGNGVDIDSDSRNITFERGRRTLNLFIPINDDNIFEQAETVLFSLQVPPDLMMIGVQLGSPSEARGIIFDDEGIL